MRTPLTITWDIAADTLQELARQESNGRVRARLIAMRLVRQGQRVPEAARAVGINERRVRNWVRRLNSEGPDGLQERPRSGRPPRLTAQQRDALAKRLDAGPSETEGLAAFHGADAQRLLADEFGVTYSLSGTYSLVHRLGFSSLVPRPRHPKADGKAQAEFKKRPSRRR